MPAVWALPTYDFEPLVAMIGSRHESQQRFDGDVGREPFQSTENQAGKTDVLTLTSYGQLLAMASWIRTRELPGALMYDVRPLQTYEKDRKQ